jgi:hypothetical protein
LETTDFLLIKDNPFGRMRSYSGSNFSTAETVLILPSGAIVRSDKVATITIRLDPSDIQMAREQAEKRGLKYQTYLKMLLYVALARKSKAP